MCDSGRGCLVCAILSRRRTDWEAGGWAGGDILDAHGELVLHDSSAAAGERGGSY